VMVAIAAAPRMTVTGLSSAASSRFGKNAAAATTADEARKWRREIWKDGEGFITLDFFWISIINRQPENEPCYGLTRFLECCRGDKYHAGQRHLRERCCSVGH